MIKSPNSNQSPSKRPKIQRPAFRVFNSIAIPRVQAKDQKQQFAKSSVHLLNSTFNGSIGTSTNHCSTSIPMNADYFRFSKILLECKTFLERQKRSLVIIEKQSEKNPQKQPCFEKILFYLNDQRFFTFLPIIFFNDVMLTISSIFNTPINQVIPSTLIYTDLPVYLKFTYYEEISIIYKIFSIILEKTDIEIIKPWITSEFIQKIIKRLNIPDIIERKDIEGIVFQIAKDIPQQKSFILNCLFNLLQDHIDHLIPYFCVSSVLQCISNILSLPGINVAGCQKLIILYLFNSYFLVRFIWEMDSALKKLYALYPEFSEDVRTFLMFNWPNKDSQNSYYFLSFYVSSLIRSKFIKNGNCIKLTTDNSDDSFTPSSYNNNYLVIVNKFYDCILSDNASNSLQAINFASNPSVYQVMIKVSPNFYDGFWKAIKKLKAAWNPFIKEAIIESTKKIKELEISTQNDGNASTKSIVEQKKREECNKKKITWDYLKQISNLV